MDFFYDEAHHKLVARSGAPVEFALPPADSELWNQMNPDLLSAEMGRWICGLVTETLARPLPDFERRFPVEGLHLTDFVQTVALRAHEAKAPMGSLAEVRAALLQHWEATLARGVLLEGTALSRLHDSYSEEAKTWYDEASWSQPLHALRVRLCEIRERFVEAPPPGAKVPINTALWRVGLEAFLQAEILRSLIRAEARLLLEHWGDPDKASLWLCPSCSSTDGDESDGFSLIFPPAAQHWHDIVHDGGLSAFLAWLRVDPAALAALALQEPTAQRGPWQQMLAGPKAYCLPPVPAPNSAEAAAWAARVLEELRVALQAGLSPGSAGAVGGEPCLVASLTSLEVHAFDAMAGYLRGGGLTFVDVRGTVVHSVDWPAAASPIRCAPEGAWHRPWDLAVDLGQGPLAIRQGFYAPAAPDSPGPELCWPLDQEPLSGLTVRAKAPTTLAEYAALCERVVSALREGGRETMAAALCRKMSEAGPEGTLPCAALARYVRLELQAVVA